MAGKIVVQGEAYAFPDQLTGREFGLVKQVTGLRAGEVEEALDAGDVELVLVLAVIAMRRAGKEVDVEDLLDLPVGEGTIEIRDEEDEEIPPADAAGSSEGAEPAAAPQRRTSRAGSSGTRRSRASTA
jgi:hypothetical protein